MKKFPAPHIRRDLSTPLLYTHTLLALLPMLVAAVYYFGVSALVISLIAALIHVGVDYFFCVLRKEPYTWDGSALVEGLIMALLLAPTVPVWLVIAASLFSSVLVRQWLVGRGGSLFSVPVSGVLISYLVFPQYSGFFIEPLIYRLNVASLLWGPSAHITTENIIVSAEHYSWMKLLSGRFPAPIGVGSSLLIMGSAVYLYAVKVWRPLAPVVFSLMWFACYFFVNPDSNIKMALYLFLSSGTFFLVIFVIGSFTAMPFSLAGRFLYGLIAGAITGLITPSVAPIPAVLISILLLNIATPILDLYIHPRAFGQKSRRKAF